MSEEKKASIKAEVFSWVKVIVSAIIIALLVDFFIIANAVVPTGSMETTIPAGSRIMGLRLYYDFKEPERGDIVIFKYPDDESVDYLKRIIGLPGETVEIISGKVYINEMCIRDRDETVQKNYKVLLDGTSDQEAVYYLMDVTGNGSPELIVGKEAMSVYSCNQGAVTTIGAMAIDTAYLSTKYGLSLIHI